MTENIPTEATDAIEDGFFDVTDEAIEQFVAAGGELPSYHPILQVWNEVLKPAADEATKKVTPQFASRIVASYNGIDYADMEHYRDNYFGKVAELGRIVALEISTDPECLTYTTPEEDVEHNSHHYKNVLRDWQLAFLSWELAWECTDPKAAVEIAAIAEVHKMFFGQTGLTQFLDNIRFEFTEADQADLAEALAELRGEEK